MPHSLSQTALLLVDVQVGFNHPTEWGIKRSNPDLEQNVPLLLGSFRKAAEEGPAHSGLSIVHVYHSSLNPASPLHASSPGIAFQPYATPLAHEPVFCKSVNSSFIGTKLEEWLREHGIRRLVVGGITTDHCVSTTIRMAANLGVTDYKDEKGEAKKGEVILVEDATATWNKGQFDAETVHQVQVESLRGEFCTVMTTSEVVTELFG